MSRFTDLFPHVMNNTFVGIVITALVISVASPADARRSDNKYFIPPPPPTPVLAVPPPPMALPYSEAYSNYKAPAAAIPVTQPRPIPSMPAAAPVAPAPHPVRPAPNFTGLSLATAEMRGFGKPRVSYVPQQAYGPGAAMAMPSTSAPAMNTWFDSSLRWYAGHASASSYYNSLANQTASFNSDVTPRAVSRKATRRHFKKVIANR
jgi:hypothetical protein